MQNKHVFLSVLLLGSFVGVAQAPHGPLSKKALKQVLSGHTYQKGVHEPSSNHSKKVQSSLPVLSQNYVKEDKGNSSPSKMGPRNPKEQAELGTMAALAHSKKSSK